MKRQTTEKRIRQFIEHVDNAPGLLRLAGLKHGTGDVVVFLECEPLMIGLSLLSYIQKRYPRKKSTKKIGRGK